jgi:hypothetical protein
LFSRLSSHVCRRWVLGFYCRSSPWRYSIHESPIEGAHRYHLLCPFEDTDHNMAILTFSVSRRILVVFRFSTCYHIQRAPVVNRFWWMALEPPQSLRHFILTIGKSYQRHQCQHTPSVMLAISTCYAKDIPSYPAVTGSPRSFVIIMMIGVS